MADRAWSIDVERRAGGPVNDSGHAAHEDELHASREETIAGGRRNRWASASLPNLESLFAKLGREGHEILKLQNTLLRVSFRFSLLQQPIDVLL